MFENRNSKMPEAQDVVAIVDELLQRAVVSGASDVHFEPTGADLKVKYRLDGMLNLVESLPAAVAELTKTLERMPDETLCMAAMRFVFSQRFLSSAITGMFEERLLEEAEVVSFPSGMAAIAAALFQFAAS